jgi:hypothetical protein
MWVDCVRGQFLLTISRKMFDPLLFLAVLFSSCSLSSGVALWLLFSIHVWPSFSFILTGCIEWVRLRVPEVVISMKQLGEGDRSFPRKIVTFFTSLYGGTFHKTDFRSSDCVWSVWGSSAYLVLISYSKTNVTAVSGAAS